MRTKYVIVNVATGIIGQLILALGNLILRRVFVYTIGLEYLGVNGLFSNILSFLALTESGVGVAMAYSLYQPIADNDKEKITVLMGFYKKIYMLIAMGVCILGLLLIPLLPYLIKDSEFSQQKLNVYYLLFLADNIASYFFAYKTTFLNANQKNYVITLVRTCVQFIGIILKSIALLFTGNFILYLLMAVLVTITNNIVISFYVTKKYSYLNKKTKIRVDQQDKTLLIRNIKGLFLHKVGAFVVFGTDNIIISAFINLKTVGIYSNYSMILSQLNTLASQIFNALIPGMGNYIATSSDTQKIYDMYKNILFINFLLYGFFTSILACILQPFVEWWIGTEGLLENTVVYLLLVDFYLKGMRNAVQIMKNAGGIFYEDRISPLIEATTNLVISIILVNKFGIAGVFVGTIVSGLVAPFWITPFFLYKNVFKMSFKYYFKDMAYYFGILLICVLGGECIGRIVLIDNLFINIIIHAIIICIFDAMVFFLLFHKKEEYKFMFEKCRDILMKMKNGEKQNVG